jgi:hypothetical protein
VERLLLLWDELDELMGYGRHLAVGLTHAVTGRGRAATPPARASGRAATAETGIYRALNPLN